MPLRSPRTACALLAALPLLALTACGNGARASHPAAAPAPSSLEAVASPASSPTPAPDVEVPAPASTAVRGRAAADPVALRPLGALLRPDVLVTGTRTFSPGALARLAALSPPAGTAVFRAGTVRLAGKPVHAVGVDPSTFRAFAAKGTAEATAVWQTVARGEAVASHAVSKSRALPLGRDVQVGKVGTSPQFLRRLGALATTGIPGTDLVVDDETGRSLGLPAATGMLLTAGKDVDPVVLAREVRAITGDGAQVDLLTPPSANPVAFLTGSKAAKAFGAFSYRYFPDGTIQPDRSWVDSNIVSGTVPILGRVTCHRLMLPQLRGALQEVVDRGLSASLHTYDGCYVPRFIESNPARSISLHTWGIAIDLDASTNYRGIKGTMDPQVVAIFKRWGFRWGGDWQYTDPMHFEMGAILTR
ncbi:MAG: family peptidase [Frankiales bacterium]|nr:family peptidase [Frankiales bacterium]